MAALPEDPAHGHIHSHGPAEADVAPKGNAHDHAHGGHSHGVPAGVSTTKLAAAVLLTLAFVAGEAAAGAWAHSLALWSDAGHNFADAVALAFSWYALWIAKKPAHAGMTFGYHRVGILAALVNAVSLVVIAILIAWEAVDRLRHPVPSHGGPMIVVAAVAVVLNLVIGLWLQAGAKHDLNVRSAYLHMMGDALSAVGVVAAGLVVLFWGSPLADPLVSFLIAGLILWSSWGILKESVNVLLEGTPAGVDLARVGAVAGNVAGVLNVHDLHVWTVGPGAIACSCHILVVEQGIRSGQEIRARVARALREEFNITHSTIQVEVDGHGDNALLCTLRPQPGNPAGHAH
jgi:cobalt-zinc-cadmium efflux system protein